MKYREIIRLAIYNAIGSRKNQSLWMMTIVLLIVMVYTHERHADLQYFIKMCEFFTLTGPTYILAQSGIDAYRVSKGMESKSSQFAESNKQQTKGTQDE